VSIVGVDEREFSYMSPAWAKESEEEGFYDLGGKRGGGRDDQAAKLTTLLCAGGS